MQAIRDQEVILNLPHNSANALIVGEHGAGRTMLARYVSARTDWPTLGATCHVYEGLALVTPDSKVRIHNAYDLQATYSSRHAFKDQMGIFAENGIEFTRVFVVLKYSDYMNEKMLDVYVETLRELDYGFTLVITHCELLNDVQLTSIHEKYDDSYHTTLCCFVDLDTVAAVFRPEIFIRVRKSIDRIRALMF
jgi:hypothetical protein